MPVLRAVERLVALQAQVPRDPYVALWSRLDGFRPRFLAEPIADRRAVRMTLLRATLHLVSAQDAFSLRPAMQPVIERMVVGTSPFRQVRDVDRDELLASFRRLLEERPRSRAELVDAARERWPERDAEHLGYAMYLLPTVQVTPRGIWGRSGRAAFTTLASWLGPSSSAPAAVDDLVLRYLAVFGPATPGDAQSWSGLTALREVFERLRPRLRTFRDERGRELLDVPRAPLPDPETPAPVRFLPEFDNALLGHADRSRVVPPQTPQWGDPGWGGVLVGGWFSARWRLDRTKGSAVLRVEPFHRLPRGDRAEVVAEAEDLLAFLEPEAGSRQVRLA